MIEDLRMSAPSAARNRGPILETLRLHLPATGLVLEIASGTGEHVAYLAAALPELIWQPTDPAPDRRASIDAWGSDLQNVRPACDLDTQQVEWPVSRADAILCINMVHISPWSATEGLFAGARRILSPGGLLALYGPYRQGETPLAPGNQAFDDDLRGRDPAWGLRSVEAVSTLASSCGFGPPTIARMPADNLTLLFHRL